MREAMQVEGVGAGGSLNGDDVVDARSRINMSVRPDFEVAGLVAGNVSGDGETSGIVMFEVEVDFNVSAGLEVAVKRCVANDFKCAVIGNGEACAACKSQGCMVEA